MFSFETDDFLKKKEEMCIYWKRAGFFKGRTGEVTLWG